MRVTVAYQDGRLELDVPEDRLGGAGGGPAGLPAGEVRGRVVAALEDPADYPPLLRALVPGDRVVVPFDPDLPAADSVLGGLCEVLIRGGIEPGAITLLGRPGSGIDGLPDGVAVVAHDPDDKPQLAYLATTSGGRRIYLNRLVVDADVVVPVGLLAYDAFLGYRGPWQALFPGASDAEARRDLLRLGDDPAEVPSPDRPNPALVESAEVSWLLGSQFQVGIVPGATGLARVIAGLDEAVKREGSRAVDDAWRLTVESRAELVVAGVGVDGRPTGLDTLAEALAAATMAVRPGGKIAILSRAVGPIGPALGRLIEVGDPRRGLSALKGRRDDEDYADARRIAVALASADVYLLSDLNPDLVDDLGIIPLGKAEEVRRLVAASTDCIALSRAELTRVDVKDDRPDD